MWLSGGRRRFAKPLRVKSPSQVRILSSPPDMSVRVRFAPSPTGYLHIGAARSALFNWLYARKTGGTFLLPSEETDLRPSIEESARAIIEGPGWLGLVYDEDLVFQSAKAPRHRAAALRL